MPIRIFHPKILLLVIGAFMLLAASAGTNAATGLIVYRVYLPQHNYQDIPLPTLTYHYNDGRADVVAPPCQPGWWNRVLNTLAGKRCSWGHVVNPAVGLVNVAYPDMNAYYWVTSFTMDPAMSIRIEGRFPDARYMSVSLYDSSHSTYVVNGVSSALADYQIMPDPNSVNPWQAITAAGGHFTLYAVNNPQPGEDNTLPLPSDLATGNGRLLPKPCTSNCPPLNAFERPSDIGGLLANDDNAYVVAQIQPLPDQVLIVRGKAPAIPPGEYPNHPQPWPNSAQVRYWSLCNNLYLPPYPVVVNRHWNQPPESGCAADLNVALDDNGYYTFAVGPAKSKPQQLPADVTWLPDSEQLPNVRHLLILRNMLAPDFAHGIQNVPADDQPASAQAVMGDYYPRIYPCSLGTFEQQGWQACVND